MSFLDKIEAYIEEKSNDSKLKSISKRLRENPKNFGVMKKLEQLYIERERLKKELEKRETEIDFCLNILYYNDI